MLLLLCTKRIIVQMVKACWVGFKQFIFGYILVWLYLYLVTFIFGCIYICYIYIWLHLYLVTFLFGCINIWLHLYSVVFIILWIYIWLKLIWLNFYVAVFMFGCNLYLVVPIICGNWHRCTTTYLYLVVFIFSCIYI